MLDFRIHTFLTVCKYMNFTKAAAELHITQPAVSQHIRYIEDSYGIKLFAFQGKKMQLTEEGALFLSTASAIRHDDFLLREEFEAQKIQQKKLSFGVTLTIGEYVVSNILSQYLERYPDTQVQVMVANTQELLQQMEDNEIDFALVEGYFRKSKYDYLTYSKERYVGVAGRELARSFPTGKLKLQDIFTQTLLVREPGSGSREILEKYLQLNSFSIEDFKRKIEINNINALKGLAEQNCGITFLYEIAAKKELESGNLIKLDIEAFHITHDFTFIWQKGSLFGENYKKLFRELSQ